MFLFLLSGPNNPAKAEQFSVLSWIFTWNKKFMYVIFKMQQAEQAMSFCHFYPSAPSTPWR